jgi:hypothetical protein
LFKLKECLTAIIIGNIVIVRGMLVQIDTRKQLVCLEWIDSSVKRRSGVLDSRSRDGEKGGLWHEGSPQTAQQAETSTV